MSDPFFIYPEISEDLPRRLVYELRFGTQSLGYFERAALIAIRNTCSAALMEEHSAEQRAVIAAGVLRDASVDIEAIAKKLRTFADVLTAPKTPDPESP